MKEGERKDREAQGGYEANIGVGGWKIEKE